MFLTFYFSPGTVSPAVLTLKSPQRQNPADDRKFYSDEMQGGGMAPSALLPGRHIVADLPPGRHIAADLPPCRHLLAELPPSRPATISSIGSVSASEVSHYNRRDVQVFHLDQKVII